MNGLMETVCAVCNNARASTKQGVSFQQLIRTIRKEFKAQGINLTIRSKRDKYLDNEVFYTNGYYDPEDDKESECPIEVIITHNFDKDLVWRREHSTRLLIQIFDTVVHELRHQRQYRKRKYRAGVDRENTHHEYLADLDEVDAYAISIAIELCRSLGKTRALRHLHNINLLSRFKINTQFVSPSLGMYRAEFSTSENDIIKRLAKKVYVRLQKVDTDCIFS